MFHFYWDSLLFGPQCISLERSKPFQPPIPPGIDAPAVHPCKNLMLHGVHHLPCQEKHWDSLLGQAYKATPLDYNKTRNLKHYCKTGN